MAQAVINQITERVVRGAAPNTSDILAFSDLSNVRVGLSSSTTDFTPIVRAVQAANPDVLLAGTHVPDAVVAQMKKVFSESSEALVAAVLLGPDENQKFQLVGTIWRTVK